MASKDVIPIVEGYFVLGPDENSLDVYIVNLHAGSLNAVELRTF